MNSLLFPCFGLLVLINSLVPASGWAQKLTFDTYRARVVTVAGERYKGLLEEVSDTDVRLTSFRGNGIDEDISLRKIRKVVIRRTSKKRAIITGAIIGGLAAGFASYKSLQQNQPSNAINYGITLTFAAAGGAAAGLMVGSVVNNVTGRVIRPLDRTNPERSLFRQLEPFTYRYQQNLIKRLPKTPQEQP